MAAEYIDDGGPAFPTDSDRVDSPFTKAYSGMTLRDYFAAQAIPALLSEIYSWRQELESGVPQVAAAFAYQVADAMLKARQS